MVRAGFPGWNDFLLKISLFDVVGLEFNLISVKERSKVAIGTQMSKRL